MANSRNVVLLNQILPKISLNKNPEKLDSQIQESKIVQVSHISEENTIPYYLDKDQNIFAEPPSALLKKKNVCCVNNSGLSVITTKSPVILDTFSASLSNQTMDQPNSAVLLKKGKKLFEEEQESAYLGCYERGEKFLDDEDFKIAEPGAENKVRKHIKVLTRSQSLLEQNSDSPLYESSPSLRNITDSSLLARRINSNNQSPVSQKSTVGEDSPLSMSKSNSNTHVSPIPMPIPQKISKFGESSRKNSIDSGIFEEEKMQYNFHIPLEKDSFRTRCKDISSIYTTNDSSVIQEVMEPSTPLFDPSLLKNNSISNPKIISAESKTEADNENIIITITNQA